MKKSFKIPLFSLLIFAIIVLFVMFRPTQLGGGNYYFIVSSGSMEPTLNVGDWIVCSKVNFNDVQVGDIIAVKHPTENFLVIHRVMEKGNDYLTTKGDVCDGLDNFVTYSQNVLARYTGFKIPKFGFLLFFCTRTWMGLILFYYVPCSIITVLQLRKLLKRRKDRKVLRNG